ncbi:MAG: hypothetical protein R3C03_02780 [Pirellulaceae bacterium]
MKPIARQIEKSRFRRVTQHYREHLQDRPKEWETFSSAEQLEGVRMDSSLLSADILHLHWIAYMADYPSFFQSILKTNQ